MTKKSTISSSKTSAYSLKPGLSSDFGNTDRLVDLLRFESTRTEKGKFTSLKEYVAGMQEDQKEIYYLSGDNRDAVELNPNLEYFKKRGIEVLFFIDPADIFNIPHLHEYDEKPIKGIETADLGILFRAGRLEHAAVDGGVRLSAIVARLRWLSFTQ